MAGLDPDELNELPPNAKVIFWFDDILECSKAYERWSQLGLVTDDTDRIYMKDMWGHKRGWAFYDEELGVLLKLAEGL